MTSTNCWFSLGEGTLQFRNRTPRAIHDALPTRLELDRSVSNRAIVFHRRRLCGPCCKRHREVARRMEEFPSAELAPHFCLRFDSPRDVGYGIQHVCLVFCCHAFILGRLVPRLGLWP